MAASSESEKVRSWRRLEDLSNIPISAEDNVPSLSYFYDEGVSPARAQPRSPARAQPRSPARAQPRSRAQAQARKRVRAKRSQKWSPGEKRAYLDAKVGALETVKGKDWEFISQRLSERRLGPRRTAKQCEHFWGTLRKNLRAIKRHEKAKGDPQTSEWVSYFEMDEAARSKKNFLPLKCYELMQTILEAQNKGSRSAEPAGPSHAGPEFCGSGSHAIVEAQGDAQLSIQGPLALAEPSHEEFRGSGSHAIVGADGDAQLSIQGRLASAQPSHEEFHGSGSHAIVGADGDAQRSIQERVEPFVKGIVENVVNPKLESLRCRMTGPGSTTEKKELFASISPPLVKRLVEAAVLINFRVLIARGYILDQYDPFTPLRPFFEGHINVALDNALRPTFTALKDLEVQERRRALEEKKRALELEEKEINESEELQFVSEFLQEIA